MEEKVYKIKRGSKLWSVGTVPFRGRHTAKIMAPAAVFVSILSFEQHHQSHSKSAIVNNIVGISFLIEGHLYVLHHETPNSIQYMTRFAPFKTSK